jgi:hypothetical protein
MDSDQLTSTQTNEPNKWQENETKNKMSELVLMTEVYPAIPQTMMAPLEEYILREVFPDTDYYYDEESGYMIGFRANGDRCSRINIADKNKISKLIAESRSLAPELCERFCHALIKDSDHPFISIDDIGGYEAILQRIVKRNQQKFSWVIPCLIVRWIIEPLGGCTLIMPDSIERMDTFKWALERRCERLREICAAAQSAQDSLTIRKPRTAS